MPISSSINGGNGSLRAVTRSVLVPPAGGIVSQINASLKAPVTWAKTGGDANLSVSGAGAISATSALAFGASQAINLTATGADGCVQPHALTLVALFGAVRVTDPLFGDEPVTDPLFSNDYVLEAP